MDHSVSPCLARMTLGITGAIFEARSAVIKEERQEMEHVYLIALETAKSYQQRLSSAVINNQSALSCDGHYDSSEMKDEIQNNNEVC
jgi:hypothetical protein